MFVVSLNVSPIIDHTTDSGKQVRTGIFKQPSLGPVMLGIRGFTGDDQADKRHHGWPTQAAYAFSAQEYTYWRNEHNASYPYGLFGENLTIDGLDDSKVCLGDIYRVGDARIQVTSPRLPCSTLAMAVKTNAIVKGFMSRRRVGPYFSVLSPGDIKQGDEFTLETPDPLRISIVECMELLHEEIIKPSRLREMASIVAIDSRIREKALARAASE